MKTHLDVLCQRQHYLGILTRNCSLTCSQAAKVMKNKMQENKLQSNAGSGLLAVKTNKHHSTK